jgi:hypothetical protein
LTVSILKPLFYGYLWFSKSIFNIKKTTKQTKPTFKWILRFSWFFNHRNVCGCFTQIYAYLSFISDEKRRRFSSILNIISYEKNVSRIRKKTFYLRYNIGLLKNLTKYSRNIRCFIIYYYQINFSLMSAL